MYHSSLVSERIKAMAKEKKMAVKDVLQNAGLSANTMSNMKTSMPKADNLAKIADALNCSVDYLLGRDVTSLPESIQKEIPPASNNESETNGTISRTEVQQLLCSLGYVDENYVLSDDDLGIILSVGTILDSWFKK